jgi:hypothetical protein
MNRRKDWVKIGRKKEQEMKRFESMKTKRIKVEKREREEDVKNGIEFDEREKRIITVANKFVREK